MPRYNYARLEICVDMEKLETNQEPRLSTGLTFAVPTRTVQGLIFNS